MPATQFRSPFARVAFAVLSAFWGAAAWFVLLQGGFHSSHKYSKETTFVGGGDGLLMAFIFFLLAAIAASVVLQSFNVHKLAYVAIALIFLLPPVCFVLGA